jgi:hypothetical protein
MPLVPLASHERRGVLILDLAVGEVFATADREFYVSHGCRARLARANGKALEEAGR